MTRRLLEEAVRYDRGSDVVYLIETLREPYRARIDDAGLVLRFDPISGEPLGVTIRDFSSWRSEAGIDPELVRRVAVFMGRPEAAVAKALAAVLAQEAAGSP